MDIIRVRILVSIEQPMTKPAPDEITVIPEAYSEGYMVVNPARSRQSAKHGGAIQIVEIDKADNSFITEFE
jgi:hypothetical protein